MKAIVTGAASGIGLACALAIAEAAVARKEEANLLLVDYARGKLEEATASLVSRGFNAHSMCGDLSDPAAADEIAARSMELFGGVDTLISNAGVVMNAPLAEMTLDQFDRAFAINARATWLLAKACYPMLCASKGVIVATASISARQPTPAMGAYSASKSALVMLMQQLSYEWGPDGIRCNCVSPGMIHTGMTDAIYSDPARRAERAGLIPLRRIGDPEDVARVVAFLAGPDSSYITGVDLAIDGGAQTALMTALRGRPS